MPSSFLSVRSLFAAVALASAALLTGCESTGSPHMQGIQDSRVARTSSRASLAASIAAEPPGDYYVGRRYYKQDYRFWGYVRRPGQPWSTAQLVLMNEQTKLTPDREGGRLGTDNGYEYKLYGVLSESPVYEPASNGFYPEFKLTGYELKDVAPPSIYREAGALDPARRIIAKPY